MNIFNYLKYILLENVKGFFSKKFISTREQMEKMLRNMGYVFDKNNNTISISPNDTPSGNYQSYTIPVRIWGMKLNADINFSSWT